VAIDFFIVPTVRNWVLFVFLVPAHGRRRVLHFNVTANPTAQWAAQRIVEAFPDTTPPKRLLRNRDRIYGEAFRRRVQGMGFDEVLIAAPSPWQNPFVERLIGSIRRDCLDHVIAPNERHLMRVLRGDFHYYYRWRTPQAFEMDCPEPRAVHGGGHGRVVERDRVFGADDASHINASGPASASSQHLLP
jgi:putative transposase